MGRIEGNLLNLCVIVHRILIEEELSNLAERELLLWPNVSKIEDIDLLLCPHLLSLLCCHGLNADIPPGEVTFIDREVEILLRVIWALGRCVLVREELDALLGLEMELGVNPLIILVDQLHCVTSVAIHETITIGNTSVTHEHHDLVDRLRVLRKVIPKNGRIITTSQVGSRITLLRMNEMGKLGWVPKEEDWRVVGHVIPIPFLCSELEGETTRVTCAVRRTFLATHSREASRDWASLPCLEEVCR